MREVGDTRDNDGARGIAGAGGDTEGDIRAGGDTGGDREAEGDTEAGEDNGAGTTAGGNVGAYDDTLESDDTDCHSTCPIR